MERKSDINRVEQPAWFAMSATFGRELKAKTFLEAKDIKCFVPMKYEMTTDSKKDKVRKLIPAVRNLIFVYTTKTRIQAIKNGMQYLHYLTKPANGKNIPIIVPEHEMKQFIAACNTYDEKLVYLSPDEINLAKGTPVKIVGSAFDGIEGTFVKVDGVRKKRVVVMVNGIAAVMVAEFTDGYLQVLDNAQTQ